jgi:hypothetical protein
LRVQVNANHSTAAIDELIDAFGELRSVIDLPRATAQSDAALKAA